MIACQQGDVEQASNLLNESMRLFHDLADTPCSWNQLILVAHLATLDASHDRAARLLGAVEAQRGSSGIAPLAIARAVHDGALGAARSSLGDEAFLAAWVEGGTMTLEQAVAYALDESTTDSLDA